MSLMDPVERMEYAAEKWADGNIVGSNFRCKCGKWCDLDNGHSVDPNPYSIPICPDCLKEYFNRTDKKQDVYMTDNKISIEGDE